MYWISDDVLALEDGDKISIVRDGGGELTVQAGDEGAPAPLVVQRGIDTIVVKVEASK